MATVENHVNGVHYEGNGLPAGYDSDEENQRMLQRPPVIEQDLREMERRKRVDITMQSHIFREELERIIETQMMEGFMPAHMAALQQMTELLMPNRFCGSNLKGGNCLIPINDIRESDGYSRTERLLRCKLAAVYRLIDLYGWSENIYNHVTVRVSQELEHFLLNPFGLQYPEVTASSLLKVDLQGNIIDPGSTCFSFNKAGFVLHSAIHAARPDIHACIHIHHPPVVAVSAMKAGLLPISQESALIGDISYHDYNGILVDARERDQIAKDLGPVNKIMILRNHGVVVIGQTLEEALFNLQNLVLACETQVKLMPIGLENIQLMSEEARLKVRSIITGDQNHVIGYSDPSDEGDSDKVPHRSKIFEMEFEAQMRMLDNAGFRTGYGYQYPQIRVDPQREKLAIEVPPAASSFTRFLDEDKWLSPLKKLMDAKKSNEKTKWINLPKTNQKEVLEQNGENRQKDETAVVSSEEMSSSQGTPAQSPVSAESDEEVSEAQVNGGETSERQSKESSPVREGNEEKKEKSKKKGLRTPSFLKKKKAKEEKGKSVA